MSSKSLYVSLYVCLSVCLCECVLCVCDYISETVWSCRFVCMSARVCVHVFACLHVSVFV